MLWYTKIIHLSPVVFYGTLVPEAIEYSGFYGTLASEVRECNAFRGVFKRLKDPIQNRFQCFPILWGSRVLGQAS